MLLHRRAWIEKNAWGETGATGCPRLQRQRADPNTRAHRARHRGAFGGGDRDLHSRGNDDEAARGRRLGAIHRPRDSQHGAYPPFLVAAREAAAARSRELVFCDHTVIVLVQPREKLFLGRRKFGGWELAVAPPGEPLKDTRRNGSRLRRLKLIELLHVQAAAFGECIELLLSVFFELG